jgi:hypothetical protein
MILEKIYCVYMCVLYLITLYNLLPLILSRGPPLPGGILWNFLVLGCI